MIVKILGKSATFKGVIYNTTKVEKHKGELMKVSGFGALEALDHLRPQDYINYLQTVSSSNTRIRFPQFHAVISCKDKLYSKEELTRLAEEWLKGMGYGDNPYLMIFHRDTANNHIHMVSTRVGRDGKKISDSYEKLRAYQVLHEVLGKDESREAAADLEQALRYAVSTRAQFMMILEARGYSLTLSQDDYRICKYGKELVRCTLSTVDQRIAEHKKDEQRIIQLRAIIEKYSGKYSPELVLRSQKLPGQDGGKEASFSSLLSEFLSEKFGLQVIFHTKGNLPPYGYTLLDHSQKEVFKGSEIMPLAEFIRSPVNVIREENPLTHGQGDGSAPLINLDGQDAQRSDASNTLVPSSSRPEHLGSDHLYLDYRAEGLGPDNFPLTDSDEQDTNLGFAVNTLIPVREIQGEPARDQIGLDGTPQGLDSDVWLPEINLDISDDIDDEAILGRNRQRKGKARTNTR